MAETPAHLAEDITNAQHQLIAARRDGSATQIMYWAKRVNELLDTWPRSQEQQPCQ